MDCSLDSEHILQFQVNIFSNNRDITKCQSFLKSKKGHNSEKMQFELSPSIIWIALWIVNTKFFHNIATNANAIAIPRVFSENSQAKKGWIKLELNSLPNDNIIESICR